MGIRSNTVGEITLTTIKTERVTHPVLKVGEEYALTVIMDKKLRVNQCLD